jgi:hypothetical protein
MVSRVSFSASTVTGDDVRPLCEALDISETLHEIADRKAGPLEEPVLDVFGDLAFVEVDEGCDFECGERHGHEVIPIQ